MKDLEFTFHTKITIGNTDIKIKMYSSSNRQRLLGEIPS